MDKNKKEKWFIAAGQVYIKGPFNTSQEAINIAEKATNIDTNLAFFIVEGEKTCFFAEDISIVNTPWLEEVYK